MIVQYVLIDPCNPVRELMLQWYDGTNWEHRAYWGEDLLLWGTNGSASRYRVGPLPPAGQWVRLEVPASVVGLEGLNIKGMSFDAYDGQVWFDRTGKLSRVNVALGKTASQIDVLSGAAASRAVDGNTNGNFSAGSVTHTIATNQPWWDVDLGAVLPIEDIQVWNRTDGTFGSRLTNYWVFVSNDRITANDVATARAMPGVYAYHLPLQSPAMQNLRIGRSGRYVRVQLNGTTQPLSLAEVQVWAPASTMRVNLAGGGLATQSTTYKDPNLAVPYDAEYAVNGDSVSNPGQVGMISHTTGETDPHWDLDLGTSRQISDVDVFLRTDCVVNNCTTTQLANFYVFVSDQPFTTGTVASTIAQSGVGVWYHGSLIWPTVSFPVQRTGRYVRIARNNPAGGAVVTLNEVKVWSNDPPLAPLAITAPTH